jgi:hypothetical protein
VHQPQLQQQQEQLQVLLSQQLAAEVVVGAQEEYAMTS